MRSLLPLVVVFCLAGIAAGAAEPKRIFIGESDGAYVVADRVDPFTLGKPPAPPPRRDPVPPTGPEADARARLTAAEALLASSAEDRFERCISECAEAAISLRSTLAPRSDRTAEDDAELAESRELLEKCERLEGTARRLKERRDIEQEFAGLKLRITGIVTRAGRAAAAAVSGRVVREGDRLAPASAPNSTVTVRRITPKEVVFLYRGVEVTLGLE